MSVVIPCYAYGKYLTDAVTGALDQDGLDVRVIVVDDASPDLSVEVARGLASADSRVDVVVHAVNAGHISTYNDGLARVDGDYVVLLSADDVLPRNALTRAVALMEAHPRVGLVYGFPASFTDTPPVGHERVRSWSTWDGRAWLARQCRLGRNPIMSPEVVMRRAAWEEIGAYDPRFPHAADMHIWFDTALRWDIGRVNGPAQALYRVHGGNMHLTTYSGMLRDLHEKRSVFTEVLTEGRPVPAASSKMAASALRSIARIALSLAEGEVRTSGAPSDVEAYLEFAVETWPEVVASRQWRRLDSHRDVKVARLARFWRRAGHHIRWRMWRRYGL